MCIHRGRSAGARLQREQRAGEGRLARRARMRVADSRIAIPAQRTVDRPIRSLQISARSAGAAARAHCSTNRSPAAAPACHRAARDRRIKRATVYLPVVLPGAQLPARRRIAEALSSGPPSRRAAAAAPATCRSCGPRATPRRGRRRCSRTTRRWRPPARTSCSGLSGEAGSRRGAGLGCCMLRAQLTRACSSRVQQPCLHQPALSSRQERGSCLQVWCELGLAAACSGLS